MGQPQPPYGPQGPQPPNGPQSPFPGQPGQPGQYGQQAQPPGYGQQTPPPGFGQQAPQGPPGQYPPQGPPGHFPPGQQPPGFGPQGPGPGGPKKKTGLIIGGAIGAAVLLIIVGTLVSVNTGRDYVSLPRDCAEVVGDNVLDDLFDGSPPRLEGTFQRDASDFDLFGASFHGALACSAGNDDVDLTVAALLVDRERSSWDMERYFEEAVEELDDLTDGTVPRGEVVDHGFGYMGDGARGYWDTPSIGDRSIAVGVDDGRGDRYLSEFGVAYVEKNNAIIVVNVDYSGSSRPPDVKELYDTVTSVAGAVVKQIPRVAER
ncbi:hypothetical protein NE857_07720 [Nocardiopsis exhalans]|uniref:Uncharacterized protein n=1 Tax=Nocardiopsis exhalans TaxID=163604 RepID=A0ABY5DE47_9ACTN|nr:hypothetical protein [Nocardiopsis exhalans]USY21488.1 hypothetical protein NE857_07720 [Nocardiopsis exhalans]